MSSPSSRLFLSNRALGLFAVGAAGVVVLLGLTAATDSPATGGTVQNVPGLVPAPDAARSALYPSNKAPLAPSAFVKLPIGAITPRGWLRHQLELQRSGMDGNLEQISPWLDFSKSSWTDPQGRGHFGWEEFPYWIKGYGDLGYVLGDRKIIANATRWLKAAMATQRADGYLGPRELLVAFDGKADLWPQMPLLNALQSYYEYTGDRQVIDVMTRYFHWQDSIPAESFNAGYWPRVRMGDNMESIYWLYNRTGDAFLLGLADKIYHHSMQWNGIQNWHNVNIAEGFRTPTVFWEQSKDPALRDGAERNYQQVMGIYGQFPGGGFAGDENCREGFYDPRQGFETCGMVEFMHSFEMLTKITGAPVWADRCEEIAFNSFPAAMTPDLKALHYLTAANSVQLDARNKFPGLQNGGEMISYSPYEAYRCCQHNHGMGWPYYAEELWLGTPDGGLCASLYAASSVKARVGTGAGEEVSIEEVTDYPFRDTVAFKVSPPTEGAAFPLYLRVPNWCAAATVEINGQAMPAAAPARPDSYLVVKDRTWKTGDTVTLHLPMKVEVKTWEKNKESVSVDRGPLTYSLEIGMQGKPYGKMNAAWPQTEEYATTPWNYGLTLDDVKDPAKGFQVIEKSGPLADQPFTPETAPVVIKTQARQIAQWAQDPNGLLMPLQESPARTSEPVEVVSLIPMGAARLRISSFPTVSDAPTAHQWNAPPQAQAGLKGSASHVNDRDSTDALSDGLVGKSSSDETVPRFTWWDHRGTAEWVQYDFAGPRKVAGASVYWFDDTGHGNCRVPASWKLEYKQGDQWQPVPTDPNTYTTRLDAWNHVTFSPVETSALRVEVQLQPGESGGILEWKVE